MTVDNRARNWACIVYPESAPNGWMDQLGSLHVPALVSPLHDCDVKPDTGEVKKPHYHVAVKLSGKVSEAQMRGMFESFGGVGCERITDFTAYARYLCHLDENPDSGKAPYSPNDVVSFGGLDYMESVQTERDRTAIISEMQEWCEDTDTVSLASLNRYARRERPDWYRLLTTTMGTNVMGGFLKSLRWERETNSATVPESD